MKKTALHIVLSLICVYGSLYLSGIATVSHERLGIIGVFYTYCPESRPATLMAPHIYVRRFLVASAGVACLAFLAVFLDYKFRRPAWHVAVVFCWGILLFLVIPRLVYFAWT